MIQVKLKSILFLTFFILSGFGQISYSGWHYGEFSRYSDQQKNYYESWTEFQIMNKGLVAGLRYQSHNPPQPYSLEKKGDRISQYFIRYSTDYLKLSLGTFYGILGRGLVFQSFENRTIRWDTNLLGGKLEWNYKKFNGSIMMGKPRDRAGNRIEALYGGNISTSVIKSVNFGINALTSTTIDNARQTWGSFFMEN